MQGWQLFGLLQDMVLTKISKADSYLVSCYLYDLYDKLLECTSAIKAKSVKLY